MKEFFIAPIVEGQGEVEAIPILLQRLFQEVQPASFLKVNQPLRVKSGSFLHSPEYLMKFVELAARRAKLHEHGSVLILLDCEDECPSVLGPRLSQQAKAVRPDVPILVALAYREYETWFLAAAESLRGRAGLPSDLLPPPFPEGLRDAKGWLGKRMQRGYNEPNDQPSFTAAFDLGMASANSSFARLRRRMHELFTEQEQYGGLS